MGRFFKTAAQKTKIALKKLDVRGKTSLGKTIAREARAAIGEVAGAYAASKAMEHKSNAEIVKAREEAKKMTASNIETALKKWTNLMNGNPDEQEGSNGQTQQGNTGSYLGG